VTATGEFHLSFATDNAAFSDDLAGAVAAVLSIVSVRILLDGATDGKVLDTNGNTVGTWGLT
jgi:hypothetical protein